MKFSLSLTKLANNSILVVTRNEKVNNNNAKINGEPAISQIEQTTKREIMHINK